ncbi:hypothetical protein [Aeoliella sp. SH292]|uniref:hypothetical protein n=1 Tax=Aeoliella sp. SH292 TaxID=3454464 RepID=UPI003F9BD606
MSNHIIDQVVRATDGELISALVDIASSPAAGDYVTKIRLTPNEGEAIEFGRSEWNSEQLRELSTKRSRVIRIGQLLVSGDQALLDVRRDLRNQDNKSQLFDTLNLYQQHCPGNANAFINFADVAQSRLRSSTSADIGSLLGPDVQKHFEAREHALNRLESLVIEQNKQLDEQRMQLDAQYTERVTALEERHDARLKELEADYNTRQAQLDEQENTLAARTKAIDDRAATHARRDDRKELLKALTEENRLALSSETSSRRLAVCIAYLSLLVFFAAITIVLFYQAGTNDWVLIASRSGATIGTIVTAGFFIRWLNLFATKSAAEDFKLKQLQLDVQRASWLVELYFESLTAGGNAELPDELLSRLSRNLFSSEEPEHEAVTATDALASALLNSAGKLRLNIAGNEVEFSRGDLRKLLRQKIVSTEHDG